MTLNVSCVRNNWICMVYSPSTCYGIDGVFFLAGMPEKVELNMDARLYVGNLARSTTQDELTALFARAGNVTAAEAIKDRRTGESRGFAFVTMTGQDEADKAISMFNAYSLGDHSLRVSITKLEEQHNGNGPIVEPYVFEGSGVND